MKDLEMSKTSKYTNYLAVVFVLCFISNVLGGSVSTLISVYLPVVIKDLQGDIAPNQLNNISGVINAFFIFGWAIGGFTWGVISDRIGRRKALVYSIAGYGVFTILTGLMTSWEGLVLCRVMSGFGVGGEMVVATTFISEIWPKKNNAVMLGILSIAFPIGIFAAGAINVVLPDWHQGFLIGLIPLLMAVLGLFIIKESEEWLSQEQKASVFALNNVFAQENRKEVIIGSLLFGSMLIGLWAIFSWMPTWIQSLMVYDAPKERGLSMMFLGMGGLAGGFLSGWLVKLIGLRKSMLSCFTVCTVMSFVLFKTNSTVTNIVYVEIVIMALFFGASQGVLSSYIPQLFPTAIRATATGFCFNVGRLFTGSAVLFIGVLVTGLGGYGNAIFLFSLVFVLGLLVTLFVVKDDKSSINLK
ncbi:MFS transporter [Aquirufa beregesia]|nr:MFS transporter [Aquirufa beregesia]